MFIWNVSWGEAELWLKTLTFCDQRILWKEGMKTVLSCTGGGNSKVSENCSFLCFQSDNLCVFNRDGK